MKKQKWILSVDDEKGYLKETKEFILRLKSELIQKILNSSRKNNTVEINSFHYDNGSALPKK